MLSCALQGREAILKVHARGKKVDPNIAYDKISRATAGFTGAEIMHLMNQSGELRVGVGDASVPAAGAGKGFILAYEAVRCWKAAQCWEDDPGDSRKSRSTGCFGGSTRRSDGLPGDLALPGQPHLYH